MGERDTESRYQEAQAQGETETTEGATAATTTVHDLPDELLDRVLLHLGTRLHLVRAAAACRRWRRAIAEAGFLARFRSHNGAARVAGHYYVLDRCPPNARHHSRGAPEKPAVFVPAATSSPPAVGSGHFSLDFLYVAPAEVERRRRWMYLGEDDGRARHSRSREIVDSRGSLLLLNNGPWLFGFLDEVQRSPDLIVCEPVTQRCPGISRPVEFSRLVFLGAFLLDADGEGSGGGDAMSNFRVISVLYDCDRPRNNSIGKPRAFVFVQGSQGGWKLGWSPNDDDGVEFPSADKVSLAGRAAGKIYWGIETSAVLVLDESTVKFSLITFPEHMVWPYRRTSFRVIGGVDGSTVRVVRMDGQELEILGQIPESGQWVVEKSVRLKDAAAGLPGWDDKFLVQPARIVTASDTFVVLTPAEETWLFSVELETMELEREHERNKHVGLAYPCALPWPPVLRACVDHGGVVVGKRRNHRKA